MSLHEALGGLRNCPQFFVWRLTWLSDKQKFEKVPAWPAHRTDLDLNNEDQRREGLDAQNPKNWMTYDVATSELVRLRATGGQYTLGFMLTRGLGYWFLDLDECLKDGQWSPWAQWAVQNLPNALIEVSSSGRGLHFVGRGALPPHRTKPPKEWRALNPGVDLELYSGGRGIAFGLTGEARGSADDVTDCQVIAGAVAPTVFPPAVAGEDDGDFEGPRADWSGPTDDAELIALAMKSRSVASKMTGKAAFADLWTRNVAVLAKTFPKAGGEFEESEADAALASHLAYWTGCDAPRIERLMRQSALKREKWDSPGHRDYLLKFTIKGSACARQKDVYKAPDRTQRLDVAVTADQHQQASDWINKVMHAEELELRNEVVPGIAADPSVELLDRERLALLVKQRFEVFQIPVSIAMARAMVSSKTAKEETSDIPDFSREHVYVESGDVFFHIPTASGLSRTAFQAKYNRAMPVKNNGDREDAAKWCLERWGMATVFDQMYVPEKSSVFPHEGRYYANTYTPASTPEVAQAYTQVGLTAINRFCAHLWGFTSGRIEVYQGLLDFMAHNVQKPGVKIRYAPLLKGVQGDGKSQIVEVLAAAMGSRNAVGVGPSLVSNSGGFTDWAHGACVIAMEEMMMTGRQRYAIANAIKENITNGRVTINRKGKGPLRIINVSNFIGFTNFTDAVPLEDGDRRWWIIFSPYQSRTEMAMALGYGSVEGLGKGFDEIWHSLHSNAGEWRKWLLELKISDSFNPNASAPSTDEKMIMKDSGEDELHAIAKQVIGHGAYGVARDAFSSAALFNAMRAVTVADGIDLPKTSGLNNLYTQLGFRSVGAVKWQGRTHRVWVKGAMNNEMIRERLDSTVTGS